MTDDKARQTLCLLLAEKGIPVTEKTDERELLRLVLDMGSLPDQTVQALATIFDAVSKGQSADKPES